MEKTDNILIPREEYAELLRKSAMLDFILVKSRDCASYELDSTVNAVRLTLSQGEEAEESDA